jgi:hypothetical protein
MGVIASAIAQVPANPKARQAAFMRAIGDWGLVVLIGTIDFLVIVHVRRGRILIEAG